MFHRKRIVLNQPVLGFDDKGNLLNYVAIDQFSGQEFNMNRFGWMQSDISALMQADSLAIQDRILSRLNLIRSDPSNAGKSDKQLLQELIPRTVQSYGELSMFLDWYKTKYGEPLFEPLNEPDKKKDDASVDDPVVETSNVNE